MSIQVLLFLFNTATNTFGLPPGLIDSICYVESTYNVEAVHEDDGNGNSLGICQVKLSTARLMGFKGTEEQLMKPRINIYYAAKYLSHQLERYNGSIEKSVIAYNIGSAKRLTHTTYSDKVLNVWLSKGVPH